MFNSLYGVISGRNAESIFLLTGGGVEWEIAMPASDTAQFDGGGAKNEARVFTWLYHREDSMRLFGFADEKRRATFLELLKVDGLGPKNALKIMGGITQTELERALEAGDLARLEAVPGLGKKTAQKMLLTLKGKLVQEALPSSPDSPHSDLVEALSAMGYDKRAAADALARAEKNAPQDISGAEKEKFLFKEAIVYLSGASSAAGE